MWKGIQFYLFRKFKLENSPENRAITIEQIDENIDVTGNSLWVLVLAIFIASLGLNTNSTAVIIGAMLVSPLMGPIVGLGLGMAISDFEMVKRALRNLLIAVLLSILTSTIYFLISPIKQVGSELLARTEPTIYDVLIAIAGGLAGIIAGSGRLRTSNVVPGVAIATALMPPLCTVGYGIATLQPFMITGAFYLFFINSAFIFLSTYVIVKLLNYPSVQPMSERKNIAMGIWVLVLAAIIPSIFLTFNLWQRTVFEERAEKFIREEVQDAEHWVVSKEINFKLKKIQLIVLSKDSAQAWATSLNEKLPAYKLARANVEVLRNFQTNADPASMFADRMQISNNNSQAISMLRERLEALETNQNITTKSAVPKLVDSLQVFFGDRLVQVHLTPSFLLIPATQKIDTSWALKPVFKPVLSQSEKSLYRNRWKSEKVTLVW
jgi:uncharacterized hydrophobic protein (TIGR00271 family)